MEILLICCDCLEKRKINRPKYHTQHYGAPGCEELFISKTLLCTSVMQRICYGLRNLLREFRFRSLRCQFSNRIFSCKLNFTAVWQTAVIWKPGGQTLQLRVVRNDDSENYLLARLRCVYSFSSFYFIYLFLFNCV